MFANHDALRASLAASELSPTFQEQLLTLARPAARFDATPGVPTEPGQSRFGGEPHLPSDVEWPVHGGTGEPLPFLAQVDLAELVGLTDLELPTSGHLYFFYDSVEQPWGYQLSDRDGFRLVYAATPGVEQREGPSPLPAHRLNAVSAVTVPSENSSAIDWSEEEDAYFAWSDDTPDPTEHHYLGGWPTVIQEDDMAAKSSALSRGLEYRHGMDVSDDAGTWVLLAQFASHDDGDWSWGDDGCLYVWIRREDIRDGRWENAHLVLQCY